MHTFKNEAIYKAQWLKYIFASGGYNKYDTKQKMVMKKIGLHVLNCLET